VELKIVKEGKIKIRIFIVKATQPRDVPYLLLGLGVHLTTETF